MLEILHVEGLDEKKLNIKKRKTQKKQIMLCDTQRKFDEFINKIKYRNNGRYGDIPHFVVTKTGKIYQLFNTDYSSNTFKDNKIDNKQIKIAIENLGWLRKNTINGHLMNWIGDPYRTIPYVTKWREHFYWDPYSQEQLENISFLINELCEKYNIPKEVIPSQRYIENPDNFNGVICKSNFSNIYTDINPSFNFTILFNHEKEEYRI